MKNILLLFIKGYKYVISPFFGLNCRFFPSCSVYAVEAIDHYGSVKGIWLVLKRVARCNPWCKGGVDPIV